MSWSRLLEIGLVYQMVKRLRPTCLELYITTTETPTQTCAHPPPISASSLNLEGLDEYLDETMNLESSFEEPPTPQFIWLLFYYLMICSCHVRFSLLYFWVVVMCVLMPKVILMVSLIWKLWEWNIILTKTTDTNNNLSAKSCFHGLKSSNLSNFFSCFCPNSQPWSICLSHKP